MSVTSGEDVTETTPAKTSLIYLDSLGKNKLFRNSSI